MYQAAPNSLKDSLEASQFGVTRQMTTRQALADALSASRHLSPPAMLS